MDVGGFLLSLLQSEKLQTGGCHLAESRTLSRRTNWVRSGPALSGKQPKNPCSSQVLDPGDCHLGLTAPESAKQITPN